MKGGNYRKIMTDKKQLWKIEWTLEIVESMIACVTHDIYVPNKRVQYSPWVVIECWWC